MDEQQKQKRRNLKSFGLLNPYPERILDPLFKEEPDFFNTLDLLQVRYEMIRSYKLDKISVVDVCKRFGVSRQTFYNLLKKFLSEGSPGLLAKRPGPKGPSKLNIEIVNFITEQFEEQEDVNAGQLVFLIEDQFNISFHKRTIEKFLKKIRSKKKS